MERWRGTGVGGTRAAARARSRRLACRPPLPAACSPALEPTRTCSPANRLLLPHLQMAAKMRQMEEAMANPAMQSQMGNMM